MMHACIAFVQTLSVMHYGVGNLLHSKHTCTSAMHLLGSITHGSDNLMKHTHYSILYTAKLSSGKTFAVRVQNCYSQKNIHASMPVDLHCQSTRP